MLKCDGPYTCRFPKPETRTARERWTCPCCGAEYRLTKPKPMRWWRQYFAPDGYWRLTFLSRMVWHSPHHRHPMSTPEF